MHVDAAAFLQTFFEEAAEHVAELESGLLALERDPHDREVIGSVFRAAHSIKGASGTFGLEAVMHFTHALESVLDLFRQERVTFDRELSALLLEALDVLKALLQAGQSGAAAPECEPVLRARLEAVALAHKGAPKMAEPSRPKSSAEQRTMTLRIRPSRDILSQGMDPLVFLRELAEFASVGRAPSVVLDADSLPTLELLDPESCHLNWTVELETEKSDAELLEVFAFADGLCDVELQPVTAASVDAVAAPAQPPPAAQPAPRPPEPLPPAPAPRSATPGTTPAASRAPGTTHPSGRAAPGAPSAAAAASTVRVSTDKLDQLLDLVGEIVIAQAMIVEALHSRSSEDANRLQDALTAMDRNTRDLQERVMSIRMVPFASVFSRLPRVVRDLSVACGKEVRVVIEGEETEIDKAMVEQLADPLIHLVRNSIDHGLESPDDRRAAGKPVEGVISLRAFHEAGNVVIEVGDDGRGLATEAILKKAVAQGIVGPDEHLEDNQIHELIFRAGFSTAAIVSDVSGRGVGMDVVKRNVEALNGSLSIATERGRGTRIRLRLPLTLAILDGFAVRVADQRFILPLLSVVESFRPSKTQVRSVLGRPDLIDVRGSSKPILHLHRVLGVQGAIEDPCQALVCVLEANGAQLALLVDEVVGQMQVVVKSLEQNHRRTELLLGATILGDGRVAMILDVLALSKLVNASTSQSHVDRSPRTSAQEQSQWMS